MILSGARVATNENSAERRNLEILRGKIHSRGNGGTGKSIDLSGLLFLPGLINAHDHLEFNLFPKLGRRIYSNATEWAAEIHRPRESPVREHLSIPLPVRLTWGAIRNLLSGVTTVAHHNPYQDSLFGRRFPVRVLKQFGWAHSLAFSPDLTVRFQATPAAWPFIVHAAEGTDEDAKSEIARLEALGVLSPRTVLVHAIAAGSADLRTLRRHRTSVVWCPRSNLSTYGKTLAADALRCGIRVALGTDSAITSPGDLTDEIRTAVLSCRMPPACVYRMVTIDAAAVLGLSDGQGTLRGGGVADIVAVADNGQSAAEAILNLKPEFVMVGGRFRMLSERMAAGPLSAFARGFQPIRIASRDRSFVDADVARLYSDALKAIGPDLRLAGRSIHAGAAA